ncbi:hypothetical protein LCGC14_1064580 [marine sediment metagenome]|uniref:Uncharacterized protein n=1 Tax=marine sediment metagenome TaxID=412755 RepID=A0A0F9MJZ0_9ZZZZ
MKQGDLLVRRYRKLKVGRYLMRITAPFPGVGIISLS